MSRDARPFSPKAHAAMFEAALEEINQGEVKYGLPVLLGLFTGLRKRLLVHYVDSWRSETENGDQIQIPKQIQCTISDDGCYQCHDEKTRGPDGFLRPKTGQGEQRTIPIPTTWYDTFNGEKRETELSNWLDWYFKGNETWGYTRSDFGAIVWKVASRRHDTIATEHEGEVERNPFGGSTRIVPDVQPHDLRASWCAQCLRMGVNDTTLMDWGGWKHAEMIDHYRSFIGDPTGSERDKLEGNSATDAPAEVIVQVLAENGLLNTDSVNQETLEDLVDEL